MNSRSRSSVFSKSAITPSLSGRTATISSGVRPSMLFASFPTAMTLPVVRSTATTEGSFSTMPFPRRYTSVLAVPRSIATSLEKTPISWSRNIRASRNPWLDMVGLLPPPALADGGFHGMKCADRTRRACGGARPFLPEATLTGRDTSASVPDRDPSGIAPHGEGIDHDAIHLEGSRAFRNRGPHSRSGPRGGPDQREFPVRAAGGPPPTEGRQAGRGVSGAGRGPAAGGLRRHRARHQRPPGRERLRGPV